MHPSTILGPILGNIFALVVLQMMGGGTVAAVSPGSIFALILMSPKDAMLPNLIAYFGGGAISCMVAGFFLIRVFKNKKMDEKDESEVQIDHISDVENLLIEEWKGMKKAGEIPKNVHKIVIACDAGMGSSAMGASVLKNMMSKAMLDVDVKHDSLNAIDSSADLIITTDMLMERAVASRPKESIPVIGVSNLLDKDSFQEIINALKG